MDATLRLIETQPYGRPFSLAPQVKALFRPAGHILGSASAEMQIADASPEGAYRVVFSGDLGRWDHPILRDPEPVFEAQTLLIESTYGDRVHPAGSQKRLGEIIRETVGRGGCIVIPAFAIGRTEEIVWMIRQLEDRGEIPIVPLYVDSPMAVNGIEIYSRHPEDHDLAMSELLKKGINPLSCRDFHLVRTVEESKRLNQISGPMVIISSSGMATGGRVLHHLKHRLPDPKNTVILAGFQAAGTRGRALQEGARTVRIHGEDVPVRASVEIVEGLSAHADREEILRWLSFFKKPPQQVFVVHGETHSADSLAETIRRKLGWNARAARDGETVKLGV